MDKRQIIQGPQWSHTLSGLHEFTSSYHQHRITLATCLLLTSWAPLHSISNQYMTVLTGESQSSSYVLTVCLDCVGPSGYQLPSTLLQPAWEENWDFKFPNFCVGLQQTGDLPRVRPQHRHETAGYYILNGRQIKMHIALVVPQNVW